MQFRVLGPLEVDAGDGPISLGGPKQRAVLAGLLLRANEVVPADTLIAEVWGDDPPDKARNTLQTYVSNLRRSLGNGRLQGRSPGYVLVVDPPELDAARFDALVREAKRSLPVDPMAAVDKLEQALALWRGPALADVSDQEAILPEATRLDELRVDAEGDRIEGLLAGGSSAKAVGELESLVARHPLRERLWGLLMLALYREGRQAEALGAFQRARELLADELGVDPSRELMRLQKRILEQAPDLDLHGEPLRGYRLVEVIGEGALGTVHRALQPHVGREVAVKVIARATADDPAFIRRFEGEAQVVARLEHPRIVPLYDYWREPDGAYLVMRYLGGGSLRDRLIETATVPMDELVRIVDQIAEALATAHRHGVVHRNVKPENVLFDQDGNAYLSDFAIADDLVDPRATRTNGTPSYRSPEQIRRQRATPQTDVYGLGITMLECLTGRRPFSGGSVASVPERIEHEPLPSVLTDRPDLPPTVDEVIARATAKEPALRYADVLSLASAFRATSNPKAPRIAAADAPNPYKGLRSFVEADAADFFGREALIDRLVARVAEDGDRARFLGVVGPSGSGKSSVVRAGLIPALRAGAVEGSRDWFYVEMAPGPHPLEELESTLLKVATTDPPDLGELLTDDERGLAAAVEAILPPDGSRLVLVVDQLEEAFTLVDDEAERRRFLDRLADVRSDPRTTVVTTLRADFYDRPLMYPLFGELLAARTEAVPILSPEELEQAIREPAEQVGVYTDPGVVAEAIADVAHQPGALPLVQYALTEAFEQRANGRITVDTYRSVGGVTGALSARAERLYSSADADGRTAVRQVFLRLVTLGEGREDTRRLVTRRELDALDIDPPVLDGVLESYGRHRLLTFDREPATREPTVEIAHEALLGAWERLRTWIDTARDDLRADRRLARSAAEWQAAERDPSFLLRGARLEQADAWARDTDIAIGQLELAYLKASLDEREAEHRVERERNERELRAERRSRNRLRALVAVFAVAALVAGLLTVVAADQSDRAEREATIAFAREIAAASIASIDEDPERAVLLAMDAVERTRTPDGSALPEAVDALHRAVAASRVVMAEPGLGGAVAWGPGDAFAAEDKDEPGVIEIHDATSGLAIRRIDAHDEGAVKALAFSADGSTLASTGEDGRLRLWDARTGELLWERKGRGHAVDVSFDGHGSLVAASWPHERTVRVFDASSGRQISSLDINGHDTSLSPEGSRIAVAVRGGVIVLGIASGEPVFKRLVPSSISGENYGVDDVSWSPDGRSLATIGLGGLDLWNADTGSNRAYQPLGYGNGLAWTTDSSRLVSGGPDVKVWRADQGLEQIDALSGVGLGTGVASGGLAVSSDGTRVVAAGETGGLVGWDIGVQGDAEWFHAPALRYFGSARFLPDGTFFAADPDGRFTVIDPRTGEVLRTFGPRYEHEAVFDISADRRWAQLPDGWESWEVWDVLGTRLAQVPPEANVVWSPAGPRFVEDDRILDLSGDEVLRLENPGTEGRYTVWSENGRWIVAPLDGDGAGVAVWNARTGHLARILQTGTVLEEDTVEVEGNRVLVGGTSPTIWDLETGRPITELEGRPGVCDADFSPDGRLLATAGGPTIRVFNPNTGRQVLVLRGHEFASCSVDFSPDGSMLVSQSPGEIRVWAIDLDDLLAIAGDSVTRSLTDAECRQYLHLDRCSQG